MKPVMLFLALVAAWPARAAPVDMTTQTCQDWIDADDDQQDQMTAWLRGYLAAKSTTTLYDMGAARADGQTLKLYCQTHLNVTVLNAAGQWRR